MSAAPDTERIERIRAGLTECRLDAVVCTLPANVLLLSGYSPVLGTAIAIATKDSIVGLAAPEDEREFWEISWANPVLGFKSGSLDEIKTSADAVRDSLADLAILTGLTKTHRIGLEMDANYQPQTYSAMHVYGSAIRNLANVVSRQSRFEPADELLMRLRSTLTARELQRVRVACGIAADAFVTGTKQLHAGVSEAEAAMLFNSPINAARGKNFKRAYGSTWCMSGPNSAKAHGAFAHSRARKLTNRDFILVHSNSCTDGFWTDITRTYCLGEPNDRQTKMYEAVHEARRAALGSIRPGVRAAIVDCATRNVLAAHGFEKHFKHPTGHGVGFSAINHSARPRLHPKSDDVLEIGMVFNVEPAVYMEGFGGLRHCDVVTVKDKGAEVLTTFQSRIEDVVNLNGA